MCNFKCPFAERRKAYGFIICKAQMEEGKNYNDRSVAINAICGYQTHCAQTGRNEVAPEGKECYALRLNSANPVEVVEEVKEEKESVKEESTSPAPKKSSKKKATKTAEE